MGEEKTLCSEFSNFQCCILESLSLFFTHTHTVLDTVMLMWCQCITPSACVSHGWLLSFLPNFRLKVENVFPLTSGFCNGAFQAQSIFWNEIFIHCWGQCWSKSVWNVNSRIQQTFLQYLMGHQCAVFNTAVIANIFCFLAFSRLLPLTANKIGRKD